MQLKESTLVPACVSKSGACDAILVSPDQTSPEHK